MAKGGQTETRSGCKRSLEPAAVNTQAAKSPKKSPKKAGETTPKTPMKSVMEIPTEKEISLPVSATITPPKRMNEDTQKSFSWFPLPSFSMMQSLWRTPVAC